jgi:hypothetical protein
MSTSALASARRRRATNENPVPPNSSVNNATINRPVQQVQKDSPREQNQTLTPLQILQIHDIKLKELETLITEFTDEDLLTKFIDEKLENIVTLNNTNTSTTNNSSSLPLYDEKLQMYEKIVEQKIELQNTKIDDFKTSIRELITSIQNQITSNANLLNTKLEATTNFENISNEFNELKLLVIKSQNMALETSNIVNKLYEDCNSVNLRLKTLEDSVALLHKKNNTSNSNIMLQSLLSGSLFKSKDFNTFDFGCQTGENCESCENCETDEIYDENIGEIKKLNIDFGSNELVLGEEQIEDLLNIKNPDENISIHEIMTDSSTIDPETLSIEETIVSEETEPTEAEPEPTTETEPILETVTSEETEPEPVPTTEAEPTTEAGPTSEETGTSLE